MTFIPTRQPFLITSRKFPLEGEKLQQDLGKMYFDVANAMNNREIAQYDRMQINTGQRWFNNGNPQNRLQAFRQVYTLDSIASGTNVIASNIPIDARTKFTYINGVAQSLTIATALTPWNITRTDDAPYLRVNLATGNIEIITNTANWVGYSAIVVLEYILNN
jgi:hypothetical protein